MTAAGYPFGGGYEGWAENLGLFETAGHTNTAAIHRTQDLIFKSQEHRQWLLQPFFREIGLGIAFGRTRVQGARREVVVITEKFATSGASPTEASDGSFLQGVVYNDANANGHYDIGEGLPGITITPNTDTGYHGVTSSSGGYALPMANHHGPVALTFQGSAFTHTIEISMIAGQNGKADLRSQDLPAPSTSPEGEDPRAPSHDDEPALEISGNSVDGITLTLPEDMDDEDSFVLLHSLDLKTWSPLETSSEDSLEIPIEHRQSYYRLVPQE